MEVRAMGFIDEIRNQLNGMGALERQQAIVELREVIYEDAYAQSRPTSEDVTACPSCGSVSVVRKGHDRDGISGGCARTAIARSAIRRTRPSCA